MTVKNRAIMGLLVAAGALSMALLVLALAFPVGAAPNAQTGPILPTPTLVPLTDVSYTLETVGGSPAPLTYAHEAMDSFTFTKTTVQSLYPAGMTFTVGVASSAGDIESVSWSMDRQGLYSERALAQYDAASDTWIAHPWSEGGMAIGREGMFSWQVRDTAGNTIRTAPQHVAYYDPEHVWWRTENDQVIMYWYGFEEDDPDGFARNLAQYMGGVEQRWVAGFGEKLAYKPLASVYPDLESFSARNLNPFNEGVLGVTSGDGTTVQRLYDPPPVPPAGRAYSCPYIRDESYWTMDDILASLFSVIGHEMTHLYQQAAGGGRGPTWWTEGQAEWFPNNTMDYADERLRNLVALQDLPTLQGEIGYNTLAADNCNRLAYEAGASFINWFVTLYGLETLGEVIHLQYNDVILYEAIEQATGTPFLTIENKWRAYNGFALLNPADLDPSLALQPYEDSLFAVGDQVTMPALPAMALIYADPAPNAAVSGSCWANMEVEILRMGQLDGVAYFEVDCLGQVGWMTRDQLVGE